MWGFLRQFSSTPTPKPPRRDAIEAAFIAQSKALIALVQQQQATLDRIVTSQYDRPIERVQHAPAAEQMPLWGMNDQGDVRPDPLSDAIASLTEDSDAAWIEKANIQ